MRQKVIMLNKRFWKCKVTKCKFHFSFFQNHLTLIRVSASTLYKKTTSWDELKAYYKEQEKFEENFFNEAIPTSLNNPILILSDDSDDDKQDSRLVISLHEDDDENESGGDIEEEPIYEEFDEGHPNNWSKYLEL